MDHFTAATLATVRAHDMDLARSALPHAPVVADRPSTRVRVAVALVRVAHVLSPGGSIATSPGVPARA